jgi:hypothetical protein
MPRREPPYITFRIPYPDAAYDPKRRDEFLESVYANGRQVLCRQASRVFPPRARTSRLARGEAVLL